MDEPLLIAENLNKSYSRSGGPFRARSAPKPALIDASLRLDRGEIIGVVGESGSGKTTLARCVALLDRPDSGRVVFKGDDLTALSGAALRTRRRYIQTIFQDPYASLNPRMRIGDALEEVIRFHRLVGRADVSTRVKKLLNQVGLPSSAASAYPAAFSGGQRQRICIARALAAEPEILIADEPVSALDVSIQAQVVNLLLDLRQQLQSRRFRKANPSRMPSMPIRANSSTQSRGWKTCVPPKGRVGLDRNGSRLRNCVERRTLGRNHAHGARIRTHIFVRPRNGTSNRLEVLMAVEINRGFSSVAVWSMSLQYCNISTL